jgi:hypothetical protein|tara:strand:- start:11608 stop:11811 length:204 start_codon:yes stop_codon:yes gene_type:complete
MSDDFIYIKNLEYVVKKYILNKIAKLFLSKKERIKQILKKNRLKISKKYRIQQEIKLLTDYNTLHTV